MARVVTVGADPEFPILTQSASRLSGVKYVPVCGLLGGDKGKPIYVDPEEGGWLEDGVMVELNPKEHRDPRVVSSRIAILHQRVADILKPKKLSLTLRDTGWYEKEALAAHPKALEFGCMPDLSAYEMGQERAVPMPAAMAQYGDTIRFAGGHVHLGVTDWPKDLPKFIAVRFLDLLLWKPAIHQWRLMSTERTGYYGLPGLYRDTPYGLEYRTPSNYWTKEAVMDGESWFLGRLKAIGNVFAEFETHKDGLVKLYNSIDWNLFQEGMAVHDFDRIFDSIPHEVHGGTNQVEFGPYLINLTNHAAIRDAAGDRLLDPIMGDINPVRAAVRGINNDWVEVNLGDIPAEGVVHEQAPFNAEALFRARRAMRVQPIRLLEDEIDDILRDQGEDQQPDEEEDADNG